jgi:hypothetical protein
MPVSALQRSRGQPLYHVGLPGLELRGGGMPRSHPAHWHQLLELGTILLLRRHLQHQRGRGFPVRVLLAASAYPVPNLLARGMLLGGRRRGDARGRRDRAPARHVLPAERLSGRDLLPRSRRLAVLRDCSACEFVWRLCFRSSGKSVLPGRRLQAGVRWPVPAPLRNTRLLRDQPSVHGHLSIRPVSGGRRLRSLGTGRSYCLDLRSRRCFRHSCGDLRLWWLPHGPGLHAAR